MPLHDLDGTNAVRTELDAEGVPVLRFFSPAMQGENCWIPAESFTICGTEAVLRLYDALGEVLKDAAAAQTKPTTSTRIQL